MRMMIVGSWQRASLEEVGTRFSDGDHSVPPKPCTLVTRWHDPSSRLFWLVVDTPDAKTIQEWTSRWSDIIDWETYPVVDDEEIGELLGVLLPG